MGSGQSALNKGDGFPSCAKWISDTSLRFGKRESPTPLVFQKQLPAFCAAQAGGNSLHSYGHLHP